MLSEFLLFVFALIINERKNISARKRLLTPKDQIDVLISFPDKPFSDKLNVFLYKQYFAKTEFYKNMINFTAISKNILFKQQGIMLKGVKSAEKQTCGYNIMPGCLLSPILKCRYWMGRIRQRFLC